MRGIGTVPARAAGRAPWLGAAGRRGADMGRRASRELLAAPAGLLLLLLALNFSGNYNILPTHYSLIVLKIDQLKIMQ